MDFVRRTSVDMRRLMLSGAANGGAGELAAEAQFIPGPSSGPAEEVPPDVPRPLAASWPRHITLFQARSRLDRQLR